MFAKNAGIFAHTVHFSGIGNAFKHGGAAAKLFANDGVGDNASSAPRKLFLSNGDEAGANEAEIAGAGGERGGRGAGNGETKTGAGGGGLNWIGTGTGNESGIGVNTCGKTAWLAQEHDELIVGNGFMQLHPPELRKIPWWQKNWKLMNQIQNEK